MQEVVYSDHCQVVQMIAENLNIHLVVTTLSLPRISVGITVCKYIEQRTLILEQSNDITWIDGSYISAADGFLDFL
jgi:CheY-like chemotaxis protein